MKAQGCLGIKFESQFKIGEYVWSSFFSNASNIMIPDGTRTIDISQAIITPIAISIPNS